MTNEPPTEGTPNPEGEELVEADLPGMGDSSTPPSEGAPQAPGSAPSPPPEGSAGDSLADALANYVESQTPDPFDNDPADSVLDELDFDIAQAMVGDPARESDGEQTEPAQTEPAQRDPTNDLDADAGDLVEADLPTTSSPRPDPSSAADPAADANPLERIDGAIEEWGNTLDAEARAHREQQLQSYRDEYGADVDAEAMLAYDQQQAAARRESGFGRVLPQSATGRLLILVLAAMGSVAAVIAAFAIFGGSDDTPAVAVPANGDGTASTVSPTTAATVAPTEASAALASEPDDLAFASADAFADDMGDLWIELQLTAPIGVDPDTLAFVYAFAVGAAVQTDNGYNGAYYAVTDGSSYAESLLGSPDFPRASAEFNANFQIGQAELWLTDDGKLAIHMPGDTATGGLDASLFGPDSVLMAGSTILEEEGGDALNTIQELTLGAIAAGGSYPLSSWVEIDPDSEPLLLNVPDTSNRN